MKHLSESELSSLADGALAPTARAAAERHLATCAPCRARRAEIEASDRALRSALDHDPGEAYFERFAGRVRERIERSEAASRVEPRSHGGSWLDWLAGPKLAWASAAAALIVAAGIVFIVARETPDTSLKDRRITARTEQVARRDKGRAAAPAEPRAAAPPAAREARTPRAAPRNAPAPDETADRTAERETEAPPSAAAPPPAAAVAPEALAKAAPSAQNMRQVKRENGEDVPVANRKEGRAATPVPMPTPLTASDGKRIVKPGAMPLAQAPAGAEVSSRVCGTVRDGSGRPIAGAQVALADLGRTAATDERGRYCIEAPAGERTLSVNAVGFHEWRGSVTVGAEADQDVALSTVTVLEPGAPPSAWRGAPSPWPASALPLVAAAEVKEAAAERTKSAASFDSAAVLWERIAHAVGHGPKAASAARRLAEARYRAWEMNPTETRAAAARSALAGYLPLAGADRAWAQGRLENLGK